MDRERSLCLLIDSCAGDERVGLPILASFAEDKQEVLTGSWAGGSKQPSKKHFSWSWGGDGTVHGLYPLTSLHLTRLAPLLCPCRLSFLVWFCCVCVWRKDSKAKVTQRDFIRKKYEVRSRAMLPVGTQDGVVSYTGSGMGSRLHRSLPWKEGGRQLRWAGSSVSFRTKCLATYPWVASCLPKGGVRSQVTEPQVSNARMTTPWEHGHRERPTGLGPGLTWRICSSPWAPAPPSLGWPGSAGILPQSIWLSLRARGIGSVTPGANLLIADSGKGP